MNAFHALAAEMDIVVTKIAQIMTNLIVFHHARWTEPSGYNV